MDTLIDISKLFHNQIWGQYSLNENESGHWRIGPLQIWIARFRSEWRIVTNSSEEHHDTTIQVKVPYETATIPKRSEWTRRYCVERTEDKLYLIPALADRSIVVRPEEAFYLPSKEETVLFINSVLWCRIFVGNSQYPKLIDTIPIYHLSDTWFGPSSIEGEICYAAKTGALQRLDLVRLSPYRVITKVYIKNLADNPLLLERIKLPVTNLSLYHAENGVFFTESVVLQREKMGQQVRFSLGRTPKEGGRLKRITTAERALEGHFVSRAMHSLFG